MSMKKGKNIRIIVWWIKALCIASFLLSVIGYVTAWEFKPDLQNYNRDARLATKQIVYKSELFKELTNTDCVPKEKIIKKQVNVYNIEGEIVQSAIDYNRIYHHQKKKLKTMGFKIK